MKVLFVSSTPFLMEPLGVLMLIGACRRAGHDTRLAILRRHRVGRMAAAFRPDVVAYSTSTADLVMFRAADREILAAAKDWPRPPFRVMGGPHPTFSPNVLEEMDLDAVCQGDGDEALPELLSRLEAGAPFDDIPNLVPRGAKEPVKRILSHDLDRFPFPERAAFYEAMPYCRTSGLRSFITGRGCPYNCSYCFNHAFNRMFKQCGPVLRRRSVDNVLDEIDQVRREFPPLRLVRFADDTFAHRVDDWLLEFAEKYPRRIGVPFYCLMRSNTLTEETARLLAGAGCQSIGMSVESGDETLRNVVLRRNLTDKLVRESFAIAEKYRITTYACTMLGIPGSTLEDDFRSLDFVRDLQPSAPIFALCTPFTGTDIWRECVKKGWLPESGADSARFHEATELSCFTPREREVQLRACYLGSLYTMAPGWAAPLVRAMIRGPFPMTLARYLGHTYTAYRISTRIFPQAIPWTPMAFLRIGLDSVRFLL